jgi:glutamate-5-semialdehyde dehydrogenase
MNSLFKLAQNARRASFKLLTLPTAKKNAVLKDLSKVLIRERNGIVAANAKDVAAALAKGLSETMIDRLVLDDKRIRAMSDAVLEVAALPDPVGEVVESCRRGGLDIKRVRIPLGVICMIYESRPNVTIDAAVLCFKSGNAAILRGGSEAFRSSLFLARLMAGVLKKHGVDPKAVQLVPTTDRESMIGLLKLEGLIDVVIPRGGEGLMRFVAEHARVPVIKHDKGVCSVFVDATAKLNESVAVVVNAKTSRPGVCNALETLYVHAGIAKKFLPPVGKTLSEKGVEIRGDAGVRRLLPYAKRATEADWGTEYLDLILAVKIVKDVEDAIAQIRKHSSRHTESILTENRKNAFRFVNALDSSCVMINTSTRFNDGGELGLGAEIGISTTKMHAYGPMGLRELTIPKFLVESLYKTRV